MPGRIGRPGKWPSKHDAPAATNFDATQRFPGSSDSIRSSHSEGGRCGINASMSIASGGLLLGARPIHFEYLGIDWGVDTIKVHIERALDIAPPADSEATEHVVLPPERHNDLLE